jgi:hypothetical protein
MRQLSNLIMEIEKVNKSESIAKRISKLETIGKKGKLNKIITLTLEHFEFIKSFILI